MNLRVTFLLLIVLLAVHDTAAAHGQWRERSPDDRQQMREQMREHWHQGGDRAAQPYDRYGGGRSREMPPEDRRRLREEMRGRAAPDYVPDRRPPRS